MKTKAIGIACIVIALTSAGCMLVQPVAVKFKTPVVVDLVTKDEAGTPIPNVLIKTRERGTRYIVPIPFTWSWLSKGWMHSSRTDTNGCCTLRFKEDMLTLDYIQEGTTIITNFTSVFYRHDGKVFVETNHVGRWQWSWGFYPDAKEPFKRKYDLIIKTESEPVFGGYSPNRGGSTRPSK